MQSWAKSRQVSFNYDKCKVMHFGKRNKEQKYTINLGQGEQRHEIEKSLFIEFIYFSLILPYKMEE